MTVQLFHPKIFSHVCDFLQEEEGAGEGHLLGRDIRVFSLANKQANAAVKNRAQQRFDAIWNPVIKCLQEKNSIPIARQVFPVRFAAKVQRVRNKFIRRPTQNLVQLLLQKIPHWRTAREPRARGACLDCCLDLVEAAPKPIRSACVERLAPTIDFGLIQGLINPDYADRNKRISFFGKIIRICPEITSTKINGFPLSYALAKNNQIPFLWKIVPVNRDAITESFSGTNIATIAVCKSDKNLLDFLRINGFHDLLLRSGRVPAIKIAVIERRDEVIAWFMQHYPREFTRIDESGMPLTHIAAMSDYISLLDQLWKENPLALFARDILHQNLAFAAIRQSSLQVLGWIYSKPVLRKFFQEKFFNLNFLTIAQNMKQRPVLDWAMTKPDLRLQFTESDSSGYQFVHNAVVGRNFPVLRWIAETYPELLQERTDEGEMIGDLALLHEAFEVVHWIGARAPETFTFPELFRGNGRAHHLVIQNNLEELQAHLRKSPRETFAVNAAGYNLFHLAVAMGHRDLANYLWTTYPELRVDGKNAAEIAFNYGHVPLLQFLGKVCPRRIPNHVIERAMESRICGMREWGIALAHARSMPVRRAVRSRDEKATQAVPFIKLQSGMKKEAIFAALRVQRLLVIAPRKGSHHKIIDRDTRAVVTILPIHSGQDIPIGTLHAIESQINTYLVRRSQSVVHG